MPMGGGEGGREGGKTHHMTALMVLLGPTENQGLLVARRAGAAAGTLECGPRIVPARGQQEPSHQGK